MRIRDDSAFISIYNKEACVTSGVQENLKKLASGLRVNGAADDASGLVISEKMRSQVRGLEQAYDNIQDGISLVQTAESGYKNISDILIRMRELCVKAGDGALSENDIKKIQQELDNFKLEIDRISQTTTFNGKQLLSADMGEISYETEYHSEGTSSAFAVEIGSLDLESITDGNILIIENEGQEYRFEFDSNGNRKEDSSIIVDISNVEEQIEKVDILKQAITSNTGLGAMIYGSHETQKTLQVYSKQQKDGEIISVRTYSYADTLKVGNLEEDTIALSYKASSSKRLGVNNLSLRTPELANNALTAIDNAIESITKQRTKLGVLQNELEYTLNRAEIENTNTEAARSRITDVNMAKEVVTLAKNRILSECVPSIMAQANQSRASVLILLGNEE